MEIEKKLNYKFQEKDERDYKIKMENHGLILKTKKGESTKILKVLPNNFIIPNISPILDQGNLGSCVANSASLIISTQTKKVTNLSRILLYAICRICDNTSLNQDDGTYIRTCCEVLRKYGVCQESIYPYNINLFSTLPSLNALKNLNLLKNFMYYSVNQDINSFKHTLVTFNKPIIFGIMIYSSFMSSQVASTGIVPMPNKTKETLLGGHCVTMIGYDDNKLCFVCANSWGTYWGNKGLFYLPYNYVIDPNLAGDFYYFTFG
jgi:C1A family cysteine protease